MAGGAVALGSVVICPHGAPVMVVPVQERVRSFGLPLACVTDEGLSEGCPFELPSPAGPIPDPCVRAEFLEGATRVLLEGDPLLTQLQLSLCWSLEEIPAGPAEVLEAQEAVDAL
jgi:hypothetical protein